MTIPAAITGVVQRACAPFWLASIRAPEVVESVGALGLRDRQPYFACRVAPMGPVPAPVVVSTFFNFSPAVVEPAIPSAWELAVPKAILDAQLVGIGTALPHMLAGVDDNVIRAAATLARTAAESAVTRPEGRPLFAAYAALEWPDDPMLVYWHAHYLLREFRGDGHIAALTAEGLSGIDAHVIHIAQVPDLSGLFRPSRGWAEDEWAETTESLQVRGWLEPGDQLAVTDEGRARRMAIEDRTDELAVPAYDVLGVDGCERLAQAGQTITDALIASGAASVIPTVR
jgi:hypothetical protein